MQEDRREKLKCLGDELKARREELGLSVDDVARATKIRRAYVEAVENGDDSISVGKAYFRAFVKSYASHLGLDGLEYSRRYTKIALSEEDSAGGATASTPGQKSEGISEGKAPPATGKRVPKGAGHRRGKAGRWLTTRLPVLILCAVLFAAAIAVVRRIEVETTAPPGVSGPGDASPVPGPNEGTVPGESSGQPSGQAPEGEEGHSAEETEEMAGPGGETAGSEITKTTKSRDTVEYTVKAGSLTVIVKTLQVDDERCWVRAICDGKVAFESILGPRSERAFEARREIFLRLGKPWVVGLTVNGKDLGPAGPFGPVLDVVIKVETAP